jgi:S1-C subfamily serine protease
MSLKTLLSFIIFALLFSACASRQDAINAYNKAEYKRSFKLLSSHEENDPEVQYYLGKHHYYGHATPKNYQKASKWLSKSASASYLPSHEYLGYVYDFGDKTLHEDNVEALAWYRRAAENGFKGAQANLASMYEFGEGTPINIDEAVRWYRKAIQNNSQYAKCRLAKIYIDQNMDRATIISLLEDGASHHQIPCQKIYASYKNSTLKRRKNSTSGTGFFISQEGHLLTNYHVIEGKKDISVKLRSGASYHANIVASDLVNDVALLKISARTTPLNIYHNSKSKVGNKVFTIGYPLINVQGMNAKFTNGHINSLTGAKDDRRFIQTDTDIQPGNSGGALFNMAGNVIGIITKTLNQKKIYQKTSLITQNVNYALKISYAKKLIAKHVNRHAPTKYRAKTLSKLIAEVQQSVVLIIAK